MGTVICQSTRLTKGHVQGWKSRGQHDAYCLSCSQGGQRTEARQGQRDKGKRGCPKGAFLPLGNICVELDFFAKLQEVPCPRNSNLIYDSEIRAGLDIIFWPTRGPRSSLGLVFKALPHQ